MKKHATTHKLLRVVLAGVLASGLMIPTAAIATEQENAAAVPVEEVASSAAAPQAEIVGPADGQWTNVGDFALLGGTVYSDYVITNNVLHITSNKPMTIKMAEGKTTTSQTIQIDAGIKADLTLAGVTIESATSSPINMITNSDEDRDGVKVVNANQIKNKTMLHLTLADGTTNTLKNTTANNDGWPGIRCGWGSVLVIDDSIRNLDTNNQIVTPKNGMIGEDVTLISGQTLKAGDPITNMDSTNRGVLIAQGWGQSAGIGGGPKENGGTIIINGGDITSTSSSSGNLSYSNGAGIGGGAGGSGTTITINGGKVVAQAGYCGSGIGSGLGYYEGSGNMSCTAKADAIDIPTGKANDQGYGFFDSFTAEFQTGNVQSPGSRHYHTVAGDITLNGGYVFAKSGGHGNAFGQSCGHGPASNKNHLVRITGGTMITEADPNINNPWLYSIGARLGYTIVTGGSVFVQNRTTGQKQPMFQGIGDTAFNTTGIES